MSRLMRFLLNGALRTSAGLAIVSVLAGCAGGADKPKPTELGPNAALINVRLAWNTRIGPVSLPLVTPPPCPTSKSLSPWARGPRQRFPPSTT